MYVAENGCLGISTWILSVVCNTVRREEQEKSRLKRVCQVGLFVFMFVSYALKFNDS